MLDLVLAFLLLVFSPPADHHPDPELSPEAEIEHIRKCVKPGLAREDEDPFAGYPGYQLY